MQNDTSAFIRTACRAAVCAAAALVISGCASTGGNLPAAPATAASPAYNYIVGPGHTVICSVSPGPTM